MTIRPLQKSPDRSGFTLLELLLAMGLTALLMGIVFTALEMHWRFSLTGQDDAERVQIARAVFQRMSSDIRSVVFRPEKSTGSSDDTDEENSTTDTGTGSSTQTGSSSSTGSASTAAGGSSSGSTNGQTGPAGSTDPNKPTTPTAPTDAFGGQSLGVFGDSQTLVMHVCRPARTIGSSVSKSVFGTSDLKAVSYYLAGADGAMPATFGSSTGSGGLTRKSADQLTLSLGSSLADATSTGSAELLASEITSLSFKYHDGFEWLSEWNSDEDGKLPKAIGITIGFKEPDGVSSTLQRREVSASTNEFRIVISISQSNPFDGMAF